MRLNGVQRPRAAASGMRRTTSVSVTLFTFSSLVSTILKALNRFSFSRMRCAMACWAGPLLLTPQRSTPQAGLRRLWKERPRALATSLLSSQQPIGPLPPEAPSPFRVSLPAWLGVFVFTPTCSTARPPFMNPSSSEEFTFRVSTSVLYLLKTS